MEDQEDLIWPISVVGGEPEPMTRAEVEKALRSFEEQFEPPPSAEEIEEMLAHATPGPDVQPIWDEESLDLSSEPGRGSSPPDSAPRNVARRERTTQLSAQAQEALQQVVAKLRSGDLSPPVEVTRLPPSDPPSAEPASADQDTVPVQSASMDCHGAHQPEEVGQDVQKSSQVTYVRAPIYVKKTIEHPDGSTDEALVLAGFKTVPAFSDDTPDGQPSSHLPSLMELAKRMGVHLYWAELPDCRGWYDSRRRAITLDSSDVLVFFHELAHAAVYRLDMDQEITPEDQEVAAELAACALTWLYGMGDRTGDTWKYIGRFAQDPPAAITKVLDTVEQILSMILEESHADTP